MTPKNYLDLIDKQYWQAKKQKLSRFSIEWGTFSRGMNLEIRERLESGSDPDELALKHVFVYWVTRSNLLELYYKGKLLALGRKRRLERFCKELKELILKHPDKLTEISTEQIRTILLQGALQDE